MRVDAKALITLLGRGAAHVLVFLFLFIVLGGLATFARFLVTRVSAINWVAGAVTAGLWIIGVVGFYFLIWYAMRPEAPQWLRDNILIEKKTGKDAGLIQQFPAASLTALICVGMLTAIFVFTVASEVLASKGILVYTIDSSPHQPMSELLFRLYMWHTVDMIPLIGIWQAFDIKPPIRPINFWAQSIILVFRLAVIGFAISAISQWLKFKPASLKNSPDIEG